MSFFANFNLGSFTGKDYLNKLNSEETKVKDKLKKVVEDRNESSSNQDEVDLLYGEIKKELNKLGKKKLTTDVIESISDRIDFQKLTYEKATINLGKRVNSSSDVLLTPGIQVEKALYYLNSNDKDEFTPIVSPGTAQVTTPQTSTNQQSTATNNNGSSSTTTATTTTNTAPTVRATPNAEALELPKVQLQITSDMLSARNGETNLEKLTYTIKGAHGGAVFLDNKKLKPNEKFTQQDINDGKIKFIWDGHTVGEGQDSVKLSFVLTNPQGNQAETKELEIKVSPPEYYGESSPVTELTPDQKNAISNKLGINYSDLTPDQKLVLGSQLHNSTGSRFDKGLLTKSHLAAIKGIQDLDSVKNYIKDQNNIKAYGHLFKIGSSGDKVQALQKALNAWLIANNYPKSQQIQEDASYGAATAALVMKFQIRQGGILVDGIAGPQTLAKLAAVSYIDNPIGDTLKKALMGEQAAS
ncbi:MAG: peptidoglycan-binding protein [Candidatus Caenarcaniphilales bacterium]|nr:peptidoglycan-binding protein [Candidatus Caenarcaniphilales bacterium]